MNLNDIFEVEQLKYCYEQAYALHRHRDIPDLFMREPDTVFTLPSAGDRTEGWELINRKLDGRSVPLCCGKGMTGRSEESFQPLDFWF